MNFRHLLVGLTALGCAFAATAASTIARTSASALGKSTDPPFVDVDSGAFSSSSAAAGNGAGATADASVQLGVIKLYASSFGSAGNSIGDSHADAAYSEDITISSAGFNGMQAKVTMGVTLQGLIDPTGGGYGSVDFFFGVGSNINSFLGTWTAKSNPNFPGGFPVANVSAVAGGPLYYSGIHEITTTVTLGSAFTLIERLTLHTRKVDCGGTDLQCSFSAAGSATADFGHSSYWNGVSAISVLDPNSGLYVPADLTLFTIVSPTGLNWAESFAPVPEPSALWLMSLGGLLAAWRCHSSGRSSPP
ncbi:MAG: PEP-CTERM sorting domain-containing protein [Roseateles sp.]|uniref:PEP-CTERM sorting domain-containing protein n=1 Tax=Roseateles sp. TaxID=1971397 RepID=UPI0040375EB2